MTTNVLKQALAAATLDDAVRLIQEALGITTGDVAAMVLQPEGDNLWPTLHNDVRIKWLARWLAAELEEVAL